MELRKTLSSLELIQNNFNTNNSYGTKISLADLIVLAGNTAIENAAAKAGFKVNIPFSPGRADSSQQQTDIKSFSVLEPKADAFRNYYDNHENNKSPTNSLIDTASKLNLTVPEMTVLIGGMRALNINTGGSTLGVFTDNPGVLNNSFFVNLLDMPTKWTPSIKEKGIYEGYDRKTGKLKWKASAVDLIFSANPELRAVSEVYASDDAHKKFVEDFVNVWTRL